MTGWNSAAAELSDAALLAAGVRRQTVLEVLRPDGPTDSAIGGDQYGGTPRAVGAGRTSLAA